MKKLISVIILFLSVTLFAKPEVMFNSTVHDFGKVTRENVVKTVFNFKNTGNSVLIIDRVKTGCGCTGTLLNKKELQKGEDGSIEITFDSSDYIGSVEKTIYVYTNDPAHKVIKLKIIADVVETDNNSVQKK